MTSDINQAKHLVELGNLQGYIQQSLGWPCQILERSPEMPVHTLMLQLQPDQQGRDRVVSISFLPLAEDALEAVKLLQFYVQIPCDHHPPYQQALEKLLLAISLRTPLGSFSLDEDNQVILKDVYPYSKFVRIDQDAFIETVLLFTFVLDQFSPLLEAIGTGQMSLADAYAELP